MAQHLFELLLSVLALDEFQSVKSNFKCFISKMSSFELKSLCYALNGSKIGSKISLLDWMGGLMKAVLPLPPPESTDTLVLSVDNTLSEKFGEKFKCWGKLYNHAAHNGA